MMMCFLCVCVQVEREEVEALLPRGATELTKQQIRYLLQVSGSSGFTHVHTF